MMAVVKWKEPLFTSIPVVSLVLVAFVLLPSSSNSQWISYRRSGRHSSNLWHPNMPALPRTLRHSIGSSSRRDTGNRQIDHRSSSSHSNFYTINTSKDLQATDSRALHHFHHASPPQQQQPRYSTADFGSRGTSSSPSGKNVRISDIPVRTSHSSPQHQQQQQQQQQRSLYHSQGQRDGHVPANILNHRHLPMSAQHAKNKVNHQQQSTSSGKYGGSVHNSHQRPPSGMHDSTRRPVSQQAGQLVDSWPNSNTHHHLAPVQPNMAAPGKQVNKNAFTNLKPEQWGNNILVSNKPIEIKAKQKTAAGYQRNDNHHHDKQASDRQLVLPNGYPVKDKAAVASTINTLTKLSPKKPIFVFMRKEGINAVKAGADAGDVIKKLAGTSKLPFYNGTNALPSHSIPTVFLAPEDMSPPSGYGKIPIPNLKPKNSAKPSYTKILMPGGTHMKGTLITTTTTTTPAPTFSTTTTAPMLLGSPSASYGIGVTPTGSNPFLSQNHSLSSLSIEQKLQLLQLLKSQPNNPLADQAALAILASSDHPASAAPSPVPSPSAPVPSISSPQTPPGVGPIIQGQAVPAGQLAQQLLQQGVLPPGTILEGLPGGQQQLPPIPGVVSSTTLPPFPGAPSSISPSPSGQPAPAGSENDIHKLIGTIVESAVSNTVSTMLQHQNVFQPGGQSQLIGVGPPLHAANLPGAPSRPPHPSHFGRGPPLPPRPPQPRHPFGYPQRLPFQQQPAGRFPPQPSAGPPPMANPSAPPLGQPLQHLPPSGPPQQLPPNPSATPPQQRFPAPSGPPPQFAPQQYPPANHQQQFQQQFQPNPSAIPPQQRFPAPSGPPPQFAPQQYPPANHQQQFQQQFQPNPSAAPPQQRFPAQSGPPPQFAPQQHQQQQQPQASFVHQVQVQHPIVPQFQPPSGYSSTLQPNGPTTPAPPLFFNPSSTPNPLQFAPQPHPNAIRQQQIRKPPGVTMYERPFANKPRSPLHNALQFFGISSPRPEATNQSPSPSPTPGNIVSSTPYPRPPHGPSPIPFRGPPPPQFPSSTPHPPQHPQFQQQQFYPQQQPQHQQAQHPQGPAPPQGSQPQFGQQGDGKPKKPTLIVQTPNGPAGKKNTYVITGGGNELPELNKIMKVLNDLHVDSNNSPSPTSPSPSPSSTTPHPPIYSSSPSPSPTQFTPTRGPSPTPFASTRGPSGFPHIPNVMIKNANVGLSPTPLVSSTASPHQFVSSTTQFGASPTTPRPAIMSSTSLPMSNSSPVMQIIQQIQQQIPGAHVSPSEQTAATFKHHQQHHVRPTIMTPRPHHVSPTPSPVSPIMFSSPRPNISPSPGPIVFSSPRPPMSPTPTPSPGQVVISSTGFPRVINVSPSASATPQSIHQAVVEAIMKQQAAEAGGSPGQIVITGGPGASPGSVPQLVEVFPANGAIPGMGGGPSRKPFVVEIPPQHPPPAQETSNEQERQQHPNAEIPDLGIPLNDPRIHIQRGSLEAHETFTEKSKSQSISSVSMSSSVEHSSEGRRPVYSRERFNEKTHHHSKEVVEDYPEKARRPSYSNNKHEEQFDDDYLLNPNRRMYSGETSKQEIPSEELGMRKSSEGTTKELSDAQKLIEKIVTEEKIVWKQGPGGRGELIPAKVRTEERILIRPNSKEGMESAFSQRRTPLTSSEHFINLAKRPNTGLQSAPSSSPQQGTVSKESALASNGDATANFAGILRSKMKYDRLVEKLYPSKQLVSPFTISNHSANFQYPGRFSSGEIMPTMASSVVTTPHEQFLISSMGPTLPSLLASSLSGLLSSVSPTTDPGRFKIRPGEISHIQPEHILATGMSPSGHPVYTPSSPASPTTTTTDARYASSSSSSSAVPSPTTSQLPSSTLSFSSMAPGGMEQRLIFIPQGTAATTPIKSNKPQILITTMDELPDLMAQLSGTNPEIRMVPDKATLEAELAKVAATSTLEASTTKPTSPSTTTSPPTRLSNPPAPSSTIFSPTPSNQNGIRRMDGPEKAFTWRPAVNSTVASKPIAPIFDTSRRLVSGLGAGMLHAMSAGFGNIGSGVLNKFNWLGPSAMPPQHQAQLPPQGPTQMLYAMQNGVPVPLNIPQQQTKLPIVGPYQQVLLQSGVNGMNKDATLGYYGYNLLPQQQPPTPAAPSSTTSTKSPDFKLMYRSQYRDDELPVVKEEPKMKPIGPVHKLKKAARVRVKAVSKTTSNPIDPVSAEEYEDDDEDEQDDLIPHETLVPKHAGRGKSRHREADKDDNDSSAEDSSSVEENPRRNKPGYRRRRPGKLVTEDNEEDFNDDQDQEVRRKFKNSRSRVKVRPTKPTYDEEDDASPAPKLSRMNKQSYGRIPVPSRGRSDLIDRSDEDRDDEDEEEDYEVYDVKPAFHVDRRNNMEKNPTSAPPTSTTTSSSTTAKSKNKAIYVNREMFVVSGEDRTKDGIPKAEPVYQTHQPPLNKFPNLLIPSIISAQSVVKMSGPGTNSTGESQPTKPSTTTTTEPKPTSASTTTSTTTTATSTTTKKLSTAKAVVPTAASKLGNKKKERDEDDYTDTQHELKALLKKIQDRLADEVYDFGEDAALYDYYDELQQAVHSTKATTTTTTRGTSKPKKGKKSKKNKKKNKKNKKKNKKNKKGKKKNKKQAQRVVTQSIPTRRPVSSTTLATTPKVYLHHHQRHPVSSIEQFTSSIEEARVQPTTSTTTTSTTTTSTTTTTTTPSPPPPPPPPQAHSVEEPTSGEPGAKVDVTSGSSQSGSVEAASSVSYVFSQNAKDNAPKLRRRPLWIRRKIAAAGTLESGEGLQSVRVPNGPPGKVIRLVRRRRPLGAAGRRRIIQQQKFLQQQQEQRQEQQQKSQSVEQADKPQPVFPSTASPTTSTSTVASIEVAPPNYSSPPLEQYFEQNSLERRVGNSGKDSVEGVNGTVTLRSPKRKLKLIRLKGQRAQWRLRLQGSGDEDGSSEGGPRPAALVAPRQVSAPLPLQAPLPAPVFNAQAHRSVSQVVPSSQSPLSSSVNSARVAKSASNMITHYSTSYSAESASSSVEAKVCVRGKCQIVSRQ